VIVDRLKPWADPYQQRHVTAGINDQIRILKDAFPELSRMGVRATRETARKVLNKITGLQRGLNRSPEMRMRLSGPLDRIKQECVAAIAGTLTEGRRNLVEEWCAKSAWALVHRFSTKPPTSGSSDSPYRHIAGLLHKIIDPKGKSRPRSKRVRGDAIPDLERACERVLKTMRIRTKRSRK
jgi:hypothetical protein